MKKYVSDKTATSLLLLALAGGAAAFVVWRLRKRKAMQDAALAATHLEHIAPDSGYGGRWAHKSTYATGSLGAASH